MRRHALINELAEPTVEIPTLLVPLAASPSSIRVDRRYPADINVRVIATQKQIRARVKVIAQEIAARHRGKPITLVVVMRGGFVFAVDLIRELWDQEVEVRGMEFFQSTSYKGDKAAFEPVISALGLVNLPDAGPVIVVDDIVDAGRTMQAILSTLASPGRALETCVLLDRPAARQAPVHPQYVGFKLEGPGFVVGYGLDHDNRHRELPYLAQWITLPSAVVS